MPAARRPRRLALAALAAAGALVIGLSGCTTDAPRPTTSPTASADAPIFASDEEALAAAEEAYAAYLSVDSAILAAGGSDPDRIRTVVSPRYADRLLPEYATLGENGLSITGEATLDTTSLVERTESTVTIYGCQDVSETRIVAADGRDVTPADRPVRLPLIIDFAVHDGALFIDWSDRWSGDDFC